MRYNEISSAAVVAVCLCFQATATQAGPFSSFGALSGPLFEQAISDYVIEAGSARPFGAKRKRLRIAKRKRRIKPSTRRQMEKKHSKVKPRVVPTKNRRVEFVITEQDVTKTKSNRARNKTKKPVVRSGKPLLVIAEDVEGE